MGHWFPTCREISSVIFVSFRGSRGWCLAFAAATIAASIGGQRMVVNSDRSWAVVSDGPDETSGCRLAGRLVLEGEAPAFAALGRARLRPSLARRLAGRLAFPRGLQAVT